MLDCLKAFDTVRQRRVHTQWSNRPGAVVEKESLLQQMTVTGHRSVIAEVTDLRVAGR